MAHGRGATITENLLHFRLKDPLVPDQPLTFNLALEVVESAGVGSARPPVTVTSGVRNTGAVEEQAVSYAKRTAQAFVGLKKLRIVRIPLPSLPEQRRIVAELDALQAQVDSLKRLQADTAAELDALLPAILDRAFKGEL